MVGFDAKDKNTINTSYICAACSFILREPFQLECGHRQCQSCIEAIEGAIIKCAECDKETSKNEARLDRGCKNDMKSLEIVCSLCKWDGLFKDYEGHLDEKHRNLICEYCKQEFTSTDTLPEHKQNMCAKRNPIGGSTAHDCSNSISGNNSLGDHCNTIPQSTASNSSDHTEHQTFHTINERSTEMEFNMGETIPALVSSPTNQNNDNQMQEINEMLNTLAGVIQTIIPDRQHLGEDSIQIQNSIRSLLHDFVSLQLSVEEQRASLDGIRLNLQILQQDVESLRQQVDDMQYASYDGTLTWKINRVREKMAEAESEQQTSIYSPPFYSSPTGYKMRARLYLHGDGNARRTHVSLFFVLMRGEHDALLTFPFNYRVTFCLFDQISYQQHIIQSFRPDIKSNSFQRPRSEMNIASGIPKFVPLATIQQEGNPYVRDDMMFIKIMVDFDNLPRTLLPYVLSLNPGLPMHTRQEMIRQEAERRAQSQASQQTPTSPENSSVVTPSPSNVTNDDDEPQDPNNSN